jgi:hypothetical protein
MTTTGFVVRSMTTTDYDWRRPATKVVPYHIYLMPPEKRRGAYWSSLSEAQVFPTREAAQAEIDRALTKREYGYGPDVVPFHHKDLPTFWDCQAAYGAAKAVKRVTETWERREQAKKATASRLAAELFAKSK